MKKEEKEHVQEGCEYTFTWYEPGGDNPFNKKTLDVRSLTWNVVATTKDESIAQLYNQLRQSNGTEYIDTSIKNEIESAVKLDYPHNGEALEGIVSKSDSMDCKWDIYIYQNVFYFVRSWTGELMYKAYVNNLSDKLRIYKIAYSKDEECQLVLSNIHFLLATHAMGRVLPHQVPAFLETDMAIALYSFSIYGNKGCYACFEDVTDTTISIEN